MIARLARSTRRALFAAGESARPAPQMFERLEGREFLSASSSSADQALASCLAESAVVQQAAPKLLSVNTTASTKKAAVKKAAVNYSGPIVITKGGTYSGNWQSLNANVPAVEIRTAQPVIIENSNIRGKGTLIQSYVDGAAKLTIRNNNAFGLNPGVKGRQVGRFLDAEGWGNVRIENNYLNGTAGIYLYDYRGNRTASQTVKVLRNVALNIDGRASDGAGGWLKKKANPEFYRQFFQINGVKGLVGAEVAWNQVTNQQGKSRVEENINIHNTTGTKGSPFRIHNNYITGGFPSDAVDATQYTSGGIMMSDNGSSFIHAYENHVINTGGVGMVISSGHDNRMYNNRILASGRLPNGNLMRWSNTAAVIWNYNNEAGFARNVGTGNVYGWINGAGIRNDRFTPDGTWVNNKPFSGKITNTTMANELKIWKNKLAKNNVDIGPQ